MAKPTSADILKVNNSQEIVGLIDEVATVVPEIGFFAASPVTKNLYYTLALTGDPSVAFRATAAERTWDAAKLATKTVECKYLDASWILECAIAKQCDWGEEMAIAIQQKAHLRSALTKIAEQTWYGTSSDAGFVGLAEIISGVTNADNDDGTMLIKAGGNTSNGGSSVFAVRTGIDSIQYAWGNDGKLNEGDIVRQVVGTAAKGAFYYAQELAGWVGLQVTSRNAAARICNLTTAVGLTDALLYDLLAKFPAGEGPDALFMNRRSLAQLRKSRTATNATGAPAPIPTEIEGVPIIVTDAIKDTEAMVA